MTINDATELLKERLMDALYAFRRAHPGLKVCEDDFITGYHSERGCIDLRLTITKRGE